MSISLSKKFKKIARQSELKKEVPNTQEAPMIDLDLKPVVQPELKKIQSLIVQELPKSVKDNVSLDYKKGML
jgi:hypothetical protein